jgi:hypothetical protein
MFVYKDFIAPSSCLPTSAMSIHSTNKDGTNVMKDETGAEINLFSFHEQHAGRLVIDPE